MLHAPASCHSLAARQPGAAELRRTGVRQRRHRAQLKHTFSKSNAEKDADPEFLFGAQISLLVRDLSDLAEALCVS